MYQKAGVGMGQAEYEEQDQHVDAVMGRKQQRVAGVAPGHLIGSPHGNQGFGSPACNASK